jgi:GNAT superfamily N-acetyltransferase
MGKKGSARYEAQRNQVTSEKSSVSPWRKKGSATKAPRHKETIPLAGRPLRLRVFVAKKNQPYGKKQHPMRTIRIASKADLNVIQHIATAAYHDTYIPIIGLEQVDFMLRKFYNLDALSEQMDQSHVFIIATEEGEDIGFASYNKMEEAPGVFKLQKLYLLPERKASGLGRFLVEKVISQALEAGGDRLVLNVNRYNKSRGFYEKLGFVITEKVDIPIGEHFFMNDYVMERQIGGGL